MNTAKLRNPPNSRLFFPKILFRKTQRGIHFRKQPHHVPCEHCQGTKTGRVVRYSHPKATTVRRKKLQAVGMSSTRAFHSRWRVLRFSTPDPPTIPKHGKFTPVHPREFEGLQGPAYFEAMIYVTLADGDAGVTCLLVLYC